MPFNKFFLREMAEDAGATEIRTPELTIYSPKQHSNKQHNNKTMLSPFAYSRMTYAELQHI